MCVTRLYFRTLKKKTTSRDG